MMMLEDHDHVHVVYVYLNAHACIFCIHVQFELIFAIDIDRSVK